MSKRDLFGYLEDNHVWYNVIIDGEQVETGQDIVRLGLPLDRVAKSLVFVCESSSRKELGLLAILPSNRRFSYRRVRERLQGYAGYHAPCGHSWYLTGNVRVATPEEVLEYSGYPVGAVPTLYHQNISIRFLDRTLTRFKRVLTGSGLPDKLIELNVEDIIRLCKPDIYDISESI